LIGDGFLRGLHFPAKKAGQVQLSTLFYSHYSNQSREKGEQGWDGRARKVQGRSKIYLVVPQRKMIKVLRGKFSKAHHRQLFVSITSRFCKSVLPYKAKISNIYFPYLQLQWLFLSLWGGLVAGYMC